MVYFTQGKFRLALATNEQRSVLLLRLIVILYVLFKYLSNRLIKGKTSKKRMYVSAELSGRFG